jgi:pimeloyl-ACP methyl ester carboxylesterase
MIKYLLFTLATTTWVAPSLAQPATSSPKNIYGHNPKTGHYANIRGFKMYYEVYGQGQPLLFIHGNGGSISSFSGLIAYFSKKYKVILADSRAQGKSTDFSDSLSYRMMADDCNALLEYLHIRSCNIIGWSDGGNIGLLLAIHHADKVAKLAITGANLYTDNRALPPDILSLTVLRDYLDSLAKLPPTPQIKNTIKVSKLNFDEPGITLSELNTIKCETLVISGDHDVMLPKHTLLIAENIPKSYLWILPNSGHSTLIYYADQFKQTVDRFFKTPYRVIKGLDRLN